MIYFDVLPGVKSKIQLLTRVPDVPVVPVIEQLPHETHQPSAPDGVSRQDKLSIIIPSFDILRVESDGSIVVAGRAEPFSKIDIVSGSNVLGTAKATENGDFAIVLDHALEPGNHRLVLRATGVDNRVMTSVQTAIVSIPDKGQNHVLALVEEPGHASRMITIPNLEEKGDSSQQTRSDSAAVQVSAGKEAREVLEMPQGKSITVDSVEVEGGMIYVTGRGDANKRVILYANSTVLGSAFLSQDGHFTIQNPHLLAAGDYIIRADLIEKDGSVIASAHVPFHSEKEETPEHGKRQPDHDATISQPASTGNVGEDNSLIIHKGDNLWTIARRVYGKGSRYTTIYLTNASKINNPDLIRPGQILTIPRVPLSEDKMQRLLDKK